MAGLEVYLAGALGVVLALLGAFFKGRSAGKSAERARQDRATVDIIKDKGTADEASARMSHPDRVEWLRKHFGR